MKKLEFKTSKGRFLLIDNDQDDNKVIQFLKDIPYGSYMNRIKLSEITEEQASEIVGSIKELNSLLKSKGVYLFANPYEDCEDKDLEWFYNELTFYNPYIFKL